jgi:hypothetical protein
MARRRSRWQVALFVASFAVYGTAFGLDLSHHRWAGGALMALAIVVLLVLLAIHTRRDRAAVVADRLRSELAADDELPTGPSS